MRFVDFISVKLSLYLVLGILLGFYFQLTTEILITLLILSICFMGVLRINKKKSPSFGILVFITTFLIGMFSISLTQPKNQHNHYLDFLNKKGTLRLKVTEVLKDNSYSQRYYAKAMSFDAVTIVGNILVYIKKDTINTSLSVDDELLCYGTINKVSPPLNPGQFNYQNYLKKLGIYGQIRLQQNESILSLTPSTTLYGRASRFRTNLIQKLSKKDFGINELGVIKALLLGQRNTITEQTLSDYKNAGAIHILAVSGLHIGILLLLFEFLLQPLTRLPKGKTIKLVLIVLLLWSYAFIAGLSPSIIRAATMFSFFAYALSLNRPTNNINILALSFCCILLFNPLMLFQVGFQMSYAAVFFIVWLNPKLQRFWYPKAWLPRKVWQLFSVSIVAQLGVLPISLFYFHQFPALFFISNLIVVPFLGGILGIGILILGLTYFNALPDFLISLYNFIIASMNAVVGWVAKQESFLFTDISLDGTQMLLAYLIIFGIVFTLQKLSFKPIILLLGSVVLFMGWSLGKTYKTQKTTLLILAHQTKNTVILHLNGKVLTVCARYPKPAEHLGKDFSVTKRINTISYDTLKNYYRLGHKQLVIMDSLGSYPITKQIDYLLLTQSPRINLERLLDTIQPKEIIADGSNYKSYVKRWKETCQKKKLPFHYTGEKGAYYFNLKN